MRFSRLVLYFWLGPVDARCARPGAARAGPTLSDQSALAARFAPVVRLVAQTRGVRAGEPYRPLDVNLLFGEPTVASRALGDLRTW